MSHRTNLISPRATWSAALALVAMIAACSPVDRVVAPESDVALARAVAQTDSPAFFVFPAAGGMGSGSITNDGVSAEYRNMICGVAARVFYRDGAAADANMQLDNPSSADRKCLTFGAAAYPRKLVITYPDNGIAQPSTGGLNVDQLGTIAVGESVQRSMGVRIAAAGARCTSLSFGRDKGGEKVWVTRTAATSWSVSSGGGTTAGACVSSTAPTTTILNFVISFTINQI